MSLDRPVEIALIGTGNRAQTIYQPLFEGLKPWVRLVAVCDPVRENADAYGGAMDVPAYYSLRDLVQARICEAALVITPIDGHSAISCYLSSHGIPHLVETSMASSLVQARQMVNTAKANNVTLRIAENFFRFPFDRIAKKIIESGFIGDVKRLTCFQDHLGYHNNSRWLTLFGHPESVQAHAHTMPTVPHRQAGARAHRHHESETFNIRLYSFPENRLVTDMAGNIKGMLGRYMRPGYTEIDGARGTIVQWAKNEWQGDLAVQQETEDWQSEAEVRYVSDEELENSGQADQVFPIVNTAEDGDWASTYVDLPIGRVEYVSPFRTSGHVLINRDYYGPAVMGHISDFAKTVRGVAQGEYTPDDALMAMMMEMGGRESARRDGARIALPLDEDLEVDALSLSAQRQKYGVDPLDVEAMLAVSYPKP
jgi:hypothetical protein